MILPLSGTKEKSNFCACVYVIAFKFYASWNENC